MTAAAAVVGVFVLPWLVPAPERLIVSDAQAAGFNNRVAVLALGAACVLMFALGFGSRTCAVGELSTSSLMDVGGGPRSQRVSRAAVAACAIGVVAAMVAIAAMVGREPVGEASYFIDRLFYARAGVVPYAQMEFSYGPLVLAVPLALSYVVTSAGGTVDFAYYLTLAVVQAAGILVAAYLLNRLSIPRSWRTVLLVWLAVLQASSITLGLNYQLFRFMLPALAAFVSLRAVQRNHKSTAAVMPVAAVVIAFAVSPEIGAATCAAIVVGLAVLGTRLAPRHWIHAGLAALAGAAALLIYQKIPGGTFSAFSSGALYFPVLPGAAAVIYVVFMLIAGWGVGRTCDFDDPPGAAAQIAWFVAALVLIVPALGRADAGHLIWNGLLGSLLAVAYVARLRTRLASSAVALAGVAWLVAHAILYVQLMSPAVLVAALHSRTISPGAVDRVAVLTGHSAGTGERLLASGELVYPAQSTIDGLARGGKVMVIARLSGVLGDTLSTDRALVAYDPAISDGSYQQVLSSISRARYVVLSATDYAAVVAPAGDETDMAVRFAQFDPATSRALTGVAFMRPPTHRSLAPANVRLRSILRSEWVVDAREGSFVILERAKR